MRHAICTCRKDLRSLLGGVSSRKSGGSIIIITGPAITISCTPFFAFSDNMPNKYSHALVLSHYESRGLISFPDRPKPRPTNTEPSHSERKRKKKKKAHPSSRAAGVPSSPPGTPLPPLPPSPCPPTTRDEDVVPSSSHRSTPSIVTEIYAPDEPSVPSKNPPTLQSSLEPEDAQISPVTTTGNSLTSETSYSLEATPRTSVSSVRESTSQGGDETGNDKVRGFILSVPCSHPTRRADKWPPKPLPPPPSRSSNNHEASKKSTSDGGVEETPNRAMSPEKGTGRIDDTSQGVGTSPPPSPPVRIIQSPPKPLKAFVDNLKPHSFFYIDGCSTRLLDDGAGTPPILRLPFHPPPGSSGSSSPDDAAPPPIPRHRRQIAPTIKKSDQLDIWTKPAKCDHDGRAPSLTIRDLTPEVTPWEEFTAVASEHLNSMRSEEGKRDSAVLPAKSPGKSVRIATPEVTMDVAVVSKNVLRKRISRLRGATFEPAGGARNVGAEKLVPRDERALGAIDARASMVWSDSDEEFLAQFENDGYFLR